MPSLEDAISLATEAHRDQKDKANAPYILHPLRVMLRMETETDRIIAMLHDVVEDSRVTLQDLQRAGYSAEIVEAIQYLTRPKEEEYEQFIERVKGNCIFRRIPATDSDPSRPPIPIHSGRPF